MDRLLRPKTLETEPSTPNCEKLYKHWKVTFQNYLEENIVEPPAATPGNATSEAAYLNALTSNARKKKLALINNISANIYELISECIDYETAMATLDAAYIRPENVVYNRHKLMQTR